MVGLVKVGADYVKQYSEVSKATGLSIESLQRLEKEFSGTGLTVEKFGDINKDTLDKMGMHGLTVVVLPMT